MRTIALILVSLICYGCGHTVDVSTQMYSSASQTHYQFARGEKAASDDDWRKLIADFERIIATDATGKWADDAQFAIASCWLWLAQNDDQQAVTEAIAAFDRLLQKYPDSLHQAEGHYWLGYCHQRVGDANRAAIHYQTVVSRHFDDAIAADAQLALGQLYEAQGYLGLARATYEAVAQQSQREQIAAQAKTRLDALARKGVLRESHPVPLSGLTQIVQEAIPTETTASPAPHLPSQTDTPKLRPPKLTQVDTPLASPSDNSIAPEKPKEQPTVANPSLVQQLGLNVRTIVIDAGHGGKDPGAVRKVGQEKQIVLKVATLLREQLTAKGYDVKLTRETDVYIPLKERTRLATKQKADMFVSIHVNSSKNTTATGIETYYLALASNEAARITAMRENAGSGYSLDELDNLVGSILKESKSTESQRLAKSIQGSLVEGTGAKDRGVHHAPFVVLIGTKVPAVLVEIGFISSPAEGKKLMTSAYQKQVAEAIADGIEQYVRSIPLAVAY